MASFRDQKATISVSKEFSTISQMVSAKLLSYYGNSESPIIISPFGLLSTLSMLLIGLTNETLEEIQNEFSIKNKDQFFDDIITMTRKLKDDVNINNIIITIDTVTVFEKYLKKVSELGAHMHFKEDEIDQLIKKVNALISKNTAEWIPNLMKPDDVNELTFLILINTIYMNLEWNLPFTESLTKDKPFNSKNTRIVKMMKHTEKSFGYFENEIYQVLRLNYDWSKTRLSMIIVLPKDDKSDPIVLNAEEFHHCFTNMRDVTINVELPQFKIESEFDLIPFFEAYRMKQMFHYMHADDMMERQIVQKVSTIRQKNIIKIDELGTKFVGATEIEDMGFSLFDDFESPKKIYQFIANHPFTHYIVHHSGIILSCGTYF
jgi:serine protease inhibitor